jgi:putative ABC transport system substrate-binding protein
VHCTCPLLTQSGHCAYSGKGPVICHFPLAAWSQSASLFAHGVFSGGHMKRREFFGLVGGAATWPLAARAQQSERMRRIGVLMNRTATDPEGQARLAAFQQALQQLGWSDDRNIRIDIRWGEDNIDRERKFAAELVALAPDVILASGTVSVTALQPISGTVPVVFAVVTDPVGAGFVDNLARPGGNLTGFMIYDTVWPGNGLSSSSRLRRA